MINAKDIFTLEREMIAELQYRLYQSNLTHEERDAIDELLNTDLSESQYDEVMKKLSDREINALDRIRNGESLNQSQINQAVLLAVKNE